MPAGVQVITNAGSVLMDENYQNLAVVAKGSKTVAPNISGRRVTLPTQGVCPLLAVRNTTNDYFQPGGYNRNSGASFILTRDDVGTFQYYYFDVASLVPTVANNARLEVYASNGRLTFSSNYQYARVVDVFGGPNQADWVGTRTYPTGRTYAVAMLERGVIRTNSRIEGNLYENNWWHAMARITNNVIEFNMMRSWMREGASVTPLTRNGARFAVIDVTGY